MKRALLSRMTRIEISIITFMYIGIHGPQWSRKRSPGVK